MLKNSFTPRLLKKVQMQGGAPGTHPQDGCRCEAYLRVRRSAARARQRGRWAFFSSLLGQGQMIVVQYPRVSRRAARRVAALVHSGDGGEEFHIFVTVPQCLPQYLLPLVEGALFFSHKAVASVERV